jgi:formate dehydrogenase subunit gamma
VTIAGFAEEVEAIIAPHLTQKGALLPVLHALQDHFGHVPKDSVAVVARALNLSRAEIHGVITYYHHFRSEPGGRHLVRMCRAEACQANGADDLVTHATKSLSCAFHGTTADQAITLEPAYCLGQCATGPAIMVDDDAVYARVTPARFDAIVKNLRSAK